MKFFPYLLWLSRVATQFDLTHPAFSQIVYRSVYGNVPFREEVLSMTRALSLQYMKQLVQQGIERGYIATDINPELAAFAITTLGEGLRHFIPTQLGLNTKQLDKEIVKKDLDLKAIDRIFDDLFRILEYGLSSKINPPKTPAMEKTECFSS